MKKMVKQSVNFLFCLEVILIIQLVFNAIILYNTKQPNTDKPNNSNIKTNQSIKEFESFYYDFEYEDNCYCSESMADSLGEENIDLLVEYYIKYNSKSMKTKFVSIKHLIKFESGSKKILNEYINKDYQKSIYGTSVYYPEWMKIYTNFLQYYFDNCIEFYPNNIGKKKHLTVSVYIRGDCTDDERELFSPKSNPFNF